MPCRRPIEFRRNGTWIRPFLLVGLLVTPGQGQEPKTEGPAISGAEKIVQEQVEAYNRHDIDAFLKTYSPEIKLYGFPGKETLSGLEAMREQYGNLFKREPDLKVKIVSRIVQGDHVIDQEEVSLRGRQFKAVAIYQVKGDKIIAVWFMD